MNVGLRERGQERFQGFEPKQLEEAAVHRDGDDCRWSRLVRADWVFSAAQVKSEMLIRHSSGSTEYPGRWES